MKKTNGQSPVEHRPGTRVVQFQPAKRDLHTSDRISVSDYNSALTVDGGQSTGSISIQLHLPFCPVRCLSCQSNVTVTHDSARIDRYIDALQTEIALVVEHLGSDRHVNRLHIGGGSPNYLSDLQLVRLIGLLEHAFRLDANTTMSLEANARYASSTQLHLLHGLGFTQISFPVHDVDPEVQLAIGRVQSFDMLREVFDSARQAGFETVSTNISYGLPNQSTQSMRRSVKLLKVLMPDRISCKVFNRRVDAFPHQLALGDSHTPSLADKLALFNVIVEELTAEEFAWIGLDCFTRCEDPLHLAQQTHQLKRNWLGYTLDTSSDILGFGTHSVSEIGPLCVQNHLGVDSWHESLDLSRLPIRSGIRMSSSEKRYRHALTDLMCNLQSDDCSPLLEHDEELHEIDGYRDRGLLEVDGDRISITPQGRFMLPQIWSETVPGQYRWHYPT
jgi:oxygen-independent coproporphyrinogen-3 oxidase